MALTEQEKVRLVEIGKRWAKGDLRYAGAGKTPEGLDDMYVGAGLEAINEMIKDRKRRSASPPVVSQGDTRGLTQHRGLHIPTMAEIVANANKPDPTAPYFDTNSDHMRQIDPLAPHYDLSGDFPKLVNPLKPGPRMPTNG